MIGKIAGKDAYRGVEIVDSGGLYHFLSAGAIFSLIPSISVEAAVQLPFLRRLNGAQMDEQYRVVSGVQVLL